MFNILSDVHSGRHSRQGSSGSGDSGVYSTEGGSGQRHPNSAQSSSGAEDSWQGPIKPNQVKMLDMAPDLKSQRPMGDELIVDVCVWKQNGGEKKRLLEAVIMRFVENVQGAFFLSCCHW